MKYRYYFVLLVVMILIIGITTACTKSKNPGASSVTQPTATLAGESQSTPDEIFELLELSATQTAMAAMGTGGQPTVVPTDSATQVTQATAGLTTETAPTTQSTTEQPASQPSPSPQPTEESAPTARPVPTATPGIPTTYKLRSGEHIYCISRRFNVNPAEVMSINGISNLVPAGFVLKIPQTGNPFPGNRALIAHPTTYQVQQSDTIYTVACEFGDVDPFAIAYANGLTEPYKLTPGQTIHIP